MKSKWKIGRQEHIPFPVVNVRLRPINTEDVCASGICQSLKLGITHTRPRALFLTQSCLNASLQTASSFTEKERGELAWEKAYREQSAGREPEAPAYLMCVQCATALVTLFLGRDEQDVALLIATAVAGGKEIILFDRNLSKG